jgi:hypothetical protein
VKIFHNENYKTLMKEVEEDIEEGKGHLIFMDQENQ